MAAENEGQEKTEQPSSKKLHESREKGQVAKSMELNSFAIFTSGLLLLFIAQSYLGEKMSFLAKKIFGSLDILEISQDNLFQFSFNGYIYYVTMLGPVLIGLIIVGLIVNIGQVGFHISSKALKPKMKKFNPISGIKRIFFSSKSITEILKSIVKLFIIGLFTYNILDDLIVSSTNLSNLTVDEIVNFMLDSAYTLLWQISLVYAAIAAADFIYQRYKFKKDMMMSKQEVKEENKQSEGDPQVKSRIRRVQFTMANKRMMQNIPQADVVITNPTHYAIALKYDISKNGAPKVLAKGMDELALRIKDIATKNNIYMHEDRELARALYKNCEVGDEIPASLFKAVAQILAYIYQLKKAKKRKQIV
ncbi:MAG: flagellar biosynthesis protein FlhB [Ignavibacteriaceae bacterium]